MIEKVKNGLKKRKVKLFIVFLLCSFFAWFVSNLSESYISNATFDLNFTDVPEDKMLMATSKEKLDIKLEAVGFQFLLFNFKNKVVDIDLSKVRKIGESYFISPDQYQKQIERQLSSSMSLQQLIQDTLFFNFQEVITKELSIEPAIELSFEQNYLLDGALKLTPSIVSITGPADEISDVKILKTSKLELDNLKSDFSNTVLIVKPDSLFNTSFSADKITVSGKVSRFSEKIIEVPIHVLNIPGNMSMRTFPDVVEVLCKAKMGDLKKLNSTDFRVTVDYNDVAKENKESNILSISLQKAPQHVFKASLVQDQVEFILSNK